MEEPDEEAWKQVSVIEEEAFYVEESYLDWEVFGFELVVEVETHVLETGDHLVVELEEVDGEEV